MSVAAGTAFAARPTPVPFDENETPLQKAVKEAYKQNAKGKKDRMPGGERKDKCAEAIANGNVNQIAAQCDDVGTAALTKLGSQELKHADNKPAGKRLVTRTVIEYKNPKAKGKADDTAPAKWPGGKLKALERTKGYLPGPVEPSSASGRNARSYGSGFLPEAGDNEDQDCVDMLTGEHFAGPGCRTADGNPIKTLTVSPGGCTHRNGSAFLGDATDRIEDDCFDAANALKTTIDMLIDEDGPESVDNDGDGRVNEDAADGINNDNGGKPAQGDTYTVEGTNGGNSEDAMTVATAFLDFNQAGCTLTTLGRLPAGSDGCRYRAVPTVIPASWTTVDTLLPRLPETGVLEPLGSATDSFTITVPRDWAGMDDTTYSFRVTTTSTTEPGTQRSFVARHAVTATKESMTRYIGLEIDSLIQRLTDAETAGEKLGGLKPIAIHPIKQTNDGALEAVLAGDFTRASNNHARNINLVTAFVKALDGGGKGLPAALFADLHARAAAILADLAAAEASTVTSAP